MNSQSDTTRPGSPAATARRLFGHLLPAAELRQELGGVGLLALAVFVAGALVAAKTPAGGHCWSAATRFGPLGACLRSGAFISVGPVAAALLPLIPLVGALYAMRRASRPLARAVLTFLPGLMLAVSVAAALLVRGAGLAAADPRAGAFGRVVASLVGRMVGTTGAWLFLAAAFYALVRLTLLRRGLRAPPQPRVSRTSSVTSARSVPAHLDTPTAADCVSARSAAPVVPAASQPTRDDVPLPSIDLLPPSLALSVDDTAADNEATEYRLIAALRSLELEVRIAARTRGPRVTRYEVEVSPSTPVRDRAALCRHVARVLKCATVRMAPIPGKVAVAIEVPHGGAANVGLRELLDSNEYRDHSRALPIALGRDVSGAPVVADLAKIPHLLITGTTGSGKSVSVSGIITSLVYRHTPRTLRFLIIDSDDAGLATHASIPHLWGSVGTDYRTAGTALDGAVAEMRARIALLAASGARNLSEFNQRATDAGTGWTTDAIPAPFLPLENRPYAGGALPSLVIVIDDLADLTRACGADVERPLHLLAARARTVGIHLIAVTRQPTAEGMTPAFLANFPGRIALRSRDEAESRAVVAHGGAETLLAEGDLLFLPPGRNEPMRLQAPLTSSTDTRRLLDWYADPTASPRAKPEPPPAATPEPSATRSPVVSPAARAVSAA